MMEERRIRYLQAMGITPWLLRGDNDDDTTIDIASEPDPAIADMDWGLLRETALGCRRCPLNQSRTNVVFGVGSLTADWLFVGEAPGAEEDKLGEPFVGRSGQLLDAMLRALGLSREQAYIANVLKCRPPENRDPQTVEMNTCAPFLNRQIELIQPRVIVAVGRVAAQRLLATDIAVGRLRGKIHRYGERQTPLVVTYHPAYLLRRPGEKAKSWQDLLIAKAVCQTTA
jgi:uracil-DNA glycosylase family 4